VIVRQQKQIDALTAGLQKVKAEVAESPHHVIGCNASRIRLRSRRHRFGAKARPRWTLNSFATPAKIFRRKG